MAKERRQGSEQGGFEQGRERSEQGRLARRSSSTPARGQFSADDPLGLGFATPFAMMRRFMEDLDGLFGGFGGSPSTASRGGTGLRAAGGGRMWAPAVEVFEQEGQLVVRAEIPGVTKDQVAIEVQDERLTISGERSEEHEQREQGFYRSERVYGRFYREIPLPPTADAEQAKATFTNGILEITMPLQRESEASRRIEIQEGAGREQGGGGQEDPTTH